MGAQMFCTGHHVHQVSEKPGSDDWRTLNLPYPIEQNLFFSIHISPIINQVISIQRKKSERWCRSQDPNCFHLNCAWCVMILGYVIEYWEWSIYVCYLLHSRWMNIYQHLNHRLFRCSGTSKWFCLNPNLLLVPKCVHRCIIMLKIVTLLLLIRRSNSIANGQRSLVSKANKYIGNEFWRCALKRSVNVVKSKEIE